ncbi:MAG: acyl-CoA thioesterase II [Jatrophihabitantaceae bacterium]
MGTDYDSSCADVGQVAVDGLVHLLDLEQIEENIFRGVSSRTRWQRAFGGQVAGQALVAAGRTVSPERHVHSLHSYFIRPGDSDAQIVYEVDRVRDGRSFTTRRVTAIQHGRPIFALSASFQLEQAGIEHQPTVPEAPAPEELPTLDQRLADADPETANYFLSTPRPIDLRYVDDPPWQHDVNEPRLGLNRVWMRAKGRLPDDPLLQVCVLTFASDMTLLDSVLLRHGLRKGQVTAMASLDHAMWFQRKFRADEWFLYTSKSPAATGGRGLATGRFFDRSGHHLASVVQEGMVRVKD